MLPVPASSATSASLPVLGRSMSVAAMLTSEQEVPTALGDASVHHSAGVPSLPARLRARLSEGGKDHQRRSRLQGPVPRRTRRARHLMKFGSSGERLTQLRSFRARQPLPQTARSFTVGRLLRAEASKGCTYKAHGEAGPPARSHLSAADKLTPDHLVAKDITAGCVIYHYHRAITGPSGGKSKMPPSLGPLFSTQILSMRSCRRGLPGRLATTAS
jgi:hypothetical protein